MVEDRKGTCRQGVEYIRYRQLEANYVVPPGDTSSVTGRDMPVVSTFPQTVTQNHTVHHVRSTGELVAGEGDIETARVGT